MKNRPNWDTYFMLQAEIAKLRSNCLSRQVGCVIVKDHRQISTGYNGTPSGIKNCFDGGCPRCLDKQNNRIKSGENLERCFCTHAEANEILKQANVKISKLEKQEVLSWISNLKNIVM